MGFLARTSYQATVPQTTGWTWQVSTKRVGERPRYLILGFQTSTVSQEINHAIFSIDGEPPKVTNCYVKIEQRRYPQEDYHLNFTADDYARAYAEVADFKKAHMSINRYVANSNINPVDYKNLYPLFVFNLSKQDERLRSGVVDVNLNVQFSEAPDANALKAYALILSDKVISMRGTGRETIE